MRRLIGSAALALALAPAPGCRRALPVVETIEEPGEPSLLTNVAMSDPIAAPQLKSGFYGLESNLWRWTARTFSVILQPPRSAPKAGARLLFRCSAPEFTIARLHSITLSAAINDRPLEPETYTKSGECLYSREVPAEVFTRRPAGQAAIVEFALDRALPPGSGDLRELGLVAVSVGLSPK